MLTRRSSAGQRGLSIVELMVGITIGLLVIAAASLVMTSQLGDNRRLLLETQLQQDMRATMDIVTRELRRAEYWATSYQGVWDEADPAGVQRNAMTVPSPMTPASGAVTEVSFRYMRRAGDAGPYGFKLEGGKVRSLMGTGWQDLTDPNVMQVTNFTVTAQPEEFQLTCPRECPVPPAASATACWPTLVMRNFDITLTAQAPTDATVLRTLNTAVRVRNDLVQFNDPVNPTKICPD